MIEYYEKKGEKFHIPKKGTNDYLATKKLYEAKKSGIKEVKKCKCRCPCNCEK